MKIIPIIVALIAGSILISGLVDINFEHHLHAPPEFSSKTKVEQRQSFNWKTFRFDTVTEIYYQRLVKERDDLDITQIISILNKAQVGDKVNFHLAGDGGLVETAFRLINTIKVSKAYVTMIVEAPVFSCHAFLAVSGNDLVMRPYTYLHFHTSSGYNQDCNTEIGEDRHVSNKEHCEVLKQAHISTIERMFDNIHILTKEEITRIKTGHDVIIKPYQYYERKAGVYHDEESNTKLNLTPSDIIKYFYSH